LKLKNLHVLITGSAGGIGTSIAQRFLEQGAKVSLHFYTQNDTHKPLLNQYPHHTYAIQANAANELEVENCLKKATSKFGMCHILIVNHAIYEKINAPVDQMSLKQWQNNVDVNLTGVFLFVREFCKQLRSYARQMSPQELEQAHASIVVIGSTAGKFGKEEHIDYATIKSGLMYGFTRTLKNEIVKIIPRGTVNCVAPGWTRTKMIDTGINEGLHYKEFQSTPLTKLATTDDVATTILFVSSPLGGHLSGNLVMVDGGMEGRVLWDENEIKARL